MSKLILTQRFSARTKQLKQLREWVREISLAEGMSEARVEQVIIGVNEACMNIIEHAYQHTEGDILFEIKRERNFIVYELTDYAQPMDCAKIKSRKLDELRPGGLGVYFIHEVMDEVFYFPGSESNGNKISMRVKI